MKQKLKDKTKFVLINKSDINEKKDTKIDEKALSENRHDFIDSCTLMQHYGYHLHMTDGPFENIKITTPDDFYMMRAILQVKEDAQIYGLE